MFSRIIVATDLSPVSAEVVKCLGSLKAFGAKHCLLAQCLSMQESASVGLSYSTEVLHQALNEQKQALERQGFTVETRIVPGFAYQELNRAATEENYQLMAVGTLKHSLASEILVGGVASDIIYHAKKPVMVMRLESVPGDEKKCRRPKGCGVGEHLLVPTDFSDNADEAFVYVEKLVGAGVKRVTLMHVQDKNKIDKHLKSRLEEFNRIDRERLEELKARLLKKGKAEVKLELCYGTPSVEIMRVIREKAPGLVVMGSQGRGLIKELFIGSVCHTIARHGAADVLLVPPAL